MVPWTLASIACWLAYRLFLKNGQLLLRAEELEQQLRECTIASAPVLYGPDAAAILESSRTAQARFR
jgi:hypothetical protein